jgi:predicted MFS family arabinose efflux permease
VIGWSVVPGVIAFVVLAVVLRGVQSHSTVRSQESGVRQELGPDSRLPTPDSFWPPILALTALTFFRLPEALLILRLQDRGVAVAAVPLVWGGLHVVRSLSSYPGGWLSDHLGPRRVVAAGGLLFAVVALIFGTPVSPVHAILLFLTLGLVAGLTESRERAVVAYLAPGGVGRAFGSYHAVVGAAALPGGLIFGWLYQSGGARTALWGSAAGMGLAVAAWLVISPSHEGR